MTVTQWIILVVFGLITIGLLGFTGWMFLKNPLPANPPPAQPDQDISGTQIPLPTYTLYPTKAPPTLTPTFTATVYADLIPEGWKQYTSGKAELWLPPSFEKQKTSDYLIMGVDKRTDQNGFQTNIGLDRDVVPSVDLDTYLRENLKNLPAYNALVDMTLLEKKRMTIGPYETMRLKIEVIISSIPVMEAFYVVKDGDNFWSIICATYYSEYHDWLPIFDQVARTFRVNP